MIVKLERTLFKVKTLYEGTRFKMTQVIRENKREVRMVQLKLETHSHELIACET